MNSGRGPTRGHCWCFSCLPCPTVLLQGLTLFTSIPKSRSECQLVAMAGTDCAGRQEHDSKTPPDVPPTRMFLLLAGGLAKPQFDGSSLSRNAAHASPEHKVPLPECLTTCSFQDGFLQPLFVPRLFLPPPTGQLLHRGCVHRNPVLGAGGILSSTPAPSTSALWPFVGICALSSQ